MSEPGLFKSVAFFIATTSWISSLLINISPFMRFDGYYIFADYLKLENLQPRAFALAKWKLREILFGLNKNAPETMQTHRRNLLILYAWSTWKYRFFLFIGIALLVSFYAFKLLGMPPRPADRVPCEVGRPAGGREPGGEHARERRA